VYYACAAGINGLAGPLHGLANQESLRWLICVRDTFEGLPTKEQLEEFAWDTLNKGWVIPGYGHAVLRLPDPRFTAQFEFGKKHMADDELFKLVQLVYEVVPGVLDKLGKVKNPWPNVDSISGTLQYFYGMKEFDFYTVLFGISRILGVTANAVWARALGQPLERPKSLTTKMLEDVVAG
jgi:citrate synthase